MNKEINLKDTVWIHNGEPTLVQGRVVEIINLEHLNEGHNPDHELYVIELKTGIDDIYEVRTWEQISLTKTGPINMFIQVAEEINQANRYLKKVGVKMPEVSAALKTKPKKRYSRRKKSNNE